MASFKWVDETVSYSGKITWHILLHRDSGQNTDWNIDILDTVQERHGSDSRWNIDSDFICPQYKRVAWCLILNSWIHCVAYYDRWSKQTSEGLGFLIHPYNIFTIDLPLVYWLSSCTITKTRDILTQCKNVFYACHEISN